MKKIEMPTFTLEPGDTSEIERITQKKEYRFVRLRDRFGFEEILPHVPREHKNLAKSTKLFDGRTPQGKDIVTDGGRMIVHTDHIELAPEWADDSVKVKAANLAVHQETAQKLADLLHQLVVMKYQSVLRNSPIQEFTFTPR